MRTPLRTHMRTDSGPRAWAVTKAPPAAASSTAAATMASSR